MALQSPSNGRGALTALVALAVLAGRPAPAAPLVFNQTPAMNAVAQINQAYGISLILKPGINATRPVTFTVDDANGPNARLLAVSDLAAVLRADFQKIYVIRKIDSDTAVSPVKLDTEANVVFGRTTVSAAEAIRTVAAVDSALVQIPADVSGDVTLSASTLGARTAAAQIARQTHTEWRVYYAIFRRGDEPRLEGQVVGQSNLGQPMIESPFARYEQPLRVKPADTTQQAANLSAPGSIAQPTPAPGTQQAANPYGNLPYGYNPYGYNPYGYPGTQPFLTFGGNGGSSDQFSSGGFSNGGFDNMGGFSNGGGLSILPPSPYGYGSGSPILINSGPVYDTVPGSAF